MDSLPDIDIDSGVRIDDYGFRGEISIRGVEFTYQMRPDNQVRTKGQSKAEICRLARVNWCSVPTRHAMGACMGAMPTGAHDKWHDMSGASMC